jgi:putative phosphoesterase
MKLGLLSDTHGHLERTERALSLLHEQGAEHFIHCGDIGSDLVLDLLLGVTADGTPLTVVPGNVDEWDPGFMRYARSLGFTLSPIERISLHDRTFAVHHGHQSHSLQQLLTDPDVEILFTGHTHIARDEQVGHVRVINPGAVYRASIPSVAVLDTGIGDALTYLEL